MDHEPQHQTVVLHYIPSDSLAPHGPGEEHEPLVLLRAASHDELTAYPRLGELLAEAAVHGWRQQRSLQVRVVPGPGQERARGV